MKRIIHRLENELGGRAAAFHTCSAVLLFQEVTDGMYAVLNSALREKGWGPDICTKTSFDYYLVTAVSPVLRVHVSSVRSLLFQIARKGVIISL